MIKGLLTEFGYGIFAEISLVMFAAIFVAIMIHTLRQPQELTSENASIPLTEEASNGRS
jgi:hypothetical protein